MHALLNEAELECGQGDHDNHQNNRLRRRGAEVKIDEAVVINLVDQGFSGFGRAAAGYRMNNAECVEEGVNRVDHQQEERGWRQ